MYKITCNKISFLRRDNYKGAEFKGVAYTDSEEIANGLKNSGYLVNGSKPLFEV